jgi:hypothetical protein
MCRSAEIGSCDNHRTDIAAVTDAQSDSDAQGKPYHPCLLPPGKGLEPAPFTAVYLFKVFFHDNGYLSSLPPNCVTATWRILRARGEFLW